MVSLKLNVVLMETFMFSQRELAELDKLREDYVTSKADEPEARDEDMLGED